MMLEYRFGFTGTRNGMTDAQKIGLRNYLAGSTGEFHHGDCIGSDAEAHDIADECGYAIVLHPPTDWSLRAFKPVPRYMCRPEQHYLARNRSICNSTMALIATPSETTEDPPRARRSGTWSTIRYARKIGMVVVIIWPDGTIKQSDRIG
jgi:hypothetical protein